MKRAKKIIYNIVSFYKTLAKNAVYLYVYKTVYVHICVFNEDGGGSILCQCPMVTITNCHREQLNS